MDTRRVETGGHRNEWLLDENQINKCTDVLPGNNPKSANEKITWRGALAHEIVGHYEAWDKGLTHSMMQ